MSLINSAYLSQWPAKSLFLLDFGFCFLWTRFAFLPLFQSPTFMHRIFCAV